jgi:hypothetical protein
MRWLCFVQARGFAALFPFVLVVGVGEQSLICTGVLANLVG